MAKIRTILINSLKRGWKERDIGLKIISPNENLSLSHMKKADHNLIVMTDLSGLKHEDWVVIAAYYSMYQASLSLLLKIGLSSKEHAATVSVLEYFFGENIGRELLEKFNSLKKEKDKLEAITIQEKYIDYMWEIKKARETVQYGVDISYEENKEIMNHARDFVNKIKLVLEELNEDVVKGILLEIKKLDKSTNES